MFKCDGLNVSSFLWPILLCVISNIGYRVCPKIKVLPSPNLSQTQDSESCSRPIFVANKQCTYSSGWDHREPSMWMGGVAPAHAFLEPPMFWTRADVHPKGTVYTGQFVCCELVITQQVRLLSAITAIIAKVPYSQTLTLTLTLTFAMIDFGNSEPCL